MAQWLVHVNFNFMFNVLHNVLFYALQTIEFFRIEFYRIYRICGKPFLVFFKMKITKNSLLPTNSIDSVEYQF